MRKFLSLIAVLLICFTALAQTKNVTGRITDAQNQPVPFATVKLKSSKAGVSAEADGSFIIKAKQGDVLIISGAGVTTKEVTVDGPTLVIQVSRKESSLTEVVVTALGISKQAKSLGYSTAKVTNSDLVQAKPISVANGLTGKVSGLQVNTINNGLFAPTRITLRGNRSLTGNNQPLIVVDGVIYYSDISTLNPEDIADVNILKGSSASAVYGSDASNGVIIITTKHGIRGANKSNVTLTSTGQIEKVAYLPALQTRFGGNGGELYVNDFNDLSTFIPYENQSYGPAYNGKTVPLGRPGPTGDQLFIPYSYVKNQKKDFFNTGRTSQQNLSFQSSDENGSFLLSLQDIESSSIMPQDKGRRDVLHMGGTKKYGIFSANYAIGYTYKNTNTTATGTVYDVLIEMPTDVPLSRLKDWRHNEFANPSGFFDDYYPSPYAIIGQVRNISTENDITGNVQLNLKLLKWLNLSYRTSINNINSRYEYKSAEIDYAPYVFSNDTVLFSNPAGTGVDTTTNQGLKYISGADNPHPAAYQTSDFNNLLYTSDFIATVNTPFAKNFTFIGTAGYSYVENKISYTPVGINGSSNLTFPVYNTSVYSNAASVSGQYVYEARKLGIFGEAQFGYKGLAFLHGAYRSDIDSRLSKDNRFIPYYDIDGSLVLSDIFKSLTDNGVLNYAKLRGAHSLTGNVSPLANGSPYIAFGAYATVPTVAPPAGFPFAASGVSGYALSTTVANPNIKPEQVVENEIGLELGLLNDRLTLGTSVYRAVTSAGIVYARISSASGFYTALINAAKTQNEGVEMDLHATVVRSRSVTWNVGVNWTHNISKVLTISGNVQQLGLSGNNGNAFAVLGQPYPVIQTYDWVRDPGTGKVIVNAQTGLPTRSGTLTDLGQANPKDIVGITTSVTWKAFTLSATADYRGGYKIFNSMGETVDHAGIGLTSAIAGRQRFVFPNSVYSTDGGKTYVNNTTVTVDDGNFNFWPTLYNSVGANYVLSADAWKLREVVLTYSLPKSVLSFTKAIKAASISISGRNLLLLRPSTNKWTDPEFSEDTGNDVGRNSVNQLPPTRIFSGTLQITF